jgi:lipoprotein-releasing system permease protein
VGARASGVAGLWLCYGLAIGLVGSTLGLSLAYTIVRNINPIHDWMGERLHIVVWDPAVYYFSKIPNQVDGAHAAIVFAGGVVSCVVGALVPALRAAFMSPVRALRNE